ncbi:hypothetical protein PYK79_26100 [Streptomyces sp. ID05-04B]|uniref:hypothetical protein n=1 Tax=unclassified Streptomyces TaxID=2593676 RepID=UPI000D1C00BA|nr:MULTISPECIES: hypothetical protein [unclassified Streptomyces]AVV40903.1 hypothetical protein C6376_05095 [Streptomyces sp. P3]MDX5566074.1 hypothetical protein [Streptomyces sp. ID05-04B]
MSGHTMRKAAATLTAAFTLASVGVLAGGTPASAATCYDGATYFSGESYYHPSSGTYTTTSRCNDINVKITNLLITPYRKVKVCFYPSSAPSYCQSNYTTVDSDWTVVASDVRDGTRYRLKFETLSWVQAYRAA